MALSTLKKKRIERGLTLRAIGEAIGVHESAVMHWERGTSRPIPQNVEPYAKQLGLTAAELLELLYPSDAAQPAA